MSVEYHSRECVPIRCSQSALCHQCVCDSVHVFCKGLSMERHYGQYSMSHARSMSVIYRRCGSLIIDVDHQCWSSIVDAVCQTAHTRSLWPTANRPSVCAPDAGLLLMHLAVEVCLEHC